MRSTISYFLVIVVAALLGPGAAFALDSGDRAHPTHVWQALT